ncbi:SICAvar type I [Plasmodium knowlesi]|uniref:SICAvar type I n=1 Tax=Plasmodium knowlesi TaxID=5850 RepID=A0A1Y3DVW8_PLAKN|nr:SICAvar type I [Plasmodium knowlesi]
MATTDGTSQNGLLGAWMKTLLDSNAGTLKTAANIQDKLKNYLVQTFDELKGNKWLSKQESYEIGKLCEDVHKHVPGVGGTVQQKEFYLKNICKGIAEIKYFMSGVRTARKAGTWDDVEEVTPLTPEKAYAHCIVGAVALAELYGDHCYLEDVINYVSPEVEKMLQTHGGAIQNLNKCKNIAHMELMFGGTLLKDKIEQWTKTERNKPLRGENWRIRGPWQYWSTVCKQSKRDPVKLEAKRKEILQQNKKSLVQFALGDSTQGSTSTASPIMEDILVNDDYKISEDTLTQALSSAITSGTVDVGKAMEKLTKAAKETEAEACMKQEGKTLCQRLQCAEQHWKFKDGKGQGEDKFWDNRVKDELNYFFYRGTALNGGTQGAKCDKNSSLDTASKAACKDITAKLELMYNNGSSGNNKLSDQIINCLLLNAYAKKLNDQAKLKGYCSIESGLKKAFDLWNENNKNAGHCRNGRPCIECKLEDDVNYGTCQIGSTNVKTKVESMLENNKRTKGDQIQKTLIEFNKGNSLCKRIECAAKSYQNNGVHGSGQVSGHTPPDWVDKFWNEHVKTLWNELAGAMTTGGKKEKGECAQVPDTNGINGFSGQRDATPSEKTACNYLHAGLSKLYNKDATSSTGDNIFKNNPSLKQAMGCFLLHAYAKHMKEKATCLIDDGIKQAFESAGQGGSNGKDVPCHWQGTDNKWEECLQGITINSTSGSGENAKTKVDNILHNDATRIDEMAKQINKVEELCDQVQCVTTRWMKQTNGGGGKKRDWNEMWTKVGEEIPKLGDALQEATSGTRRNELDQYCRDLKGEDGKAADKEACLLIAAGLKNLYNIDNSNPVEASFKRTMRCVLLNTIADKLESDVLPCRDEKHTKGGITAAFNNSVKIREENTACKTNDKCFTCERFTKYKDCTIKKNENTLELRKLKDEIDKVLTNGKNGGKEEMKQIENKAVKDICGGQCKDKSSLCDRAQCAMKQWFPDRGKDKGQESDRKEMWEKVQEQVTDLVTSIPDNGGKKAETDDLCNEVECKNGEKDCVSKTTCKLIVKALKEVHKIEENGEDEPPLKVNNRIFKSTMRCVALNAFIHKLKKQAKQGGYACAVQKGVEGAFSKGESKRKDWCGENVKGVGNGDGSCEKCQIGQCITSKIGDDGLWSKVVDMLSNDSTTNNNNNIQQTLSKIKEKVTLCDRLQCLASRVKISKKEDKFWTGQDGAVKKLWDELAGAMADNGGNNQIGNGCDQMDGNRIPTDPERRACNYLHSGLKQLYEPGTSTTGNNGILSKDNPSLRQTVGCFLLKEYAKQMQKNSKCVIEAGLKKAFQNNKSSCTNNASCIECEWDENLENCDLKIGSDNKKLNEKFNELLEQNNNNNLEENLGKINHMNNLCDYIKCAAPKWFKQYATTTNGKTTTDKTWCDFWNEGVKPTLRTMFQQIETNATKTNGVCNEFGDGNEHSVERKACNHITAGLEHINTLNGNNNQLLDRAVGCIALNMYATKIKEMSQDKCPIDEERIKQMFNVWNKNKNSSCLTPGSKNNCFLCTRKEDFNECKLSVSNTLVDTTSPSSQNGTCNKDSTEVTTQIDGLLNNEDKSNTNSINTTMKQTLDKITDMKSSFCTQVQCAAKKWNSIKKKNLNPTWTDIDDDAKGVLGQLLNYMIKPDNQKDAEQYCQNDANWKNLGHKQSKTNKAACLLFAAGLQHIYTHGNGRVNGPSFGQTMGCLFLKKYAKQLKDLAEKQKTHKVHPNCSVEEGIKHAFEQSEKIMQATPPCKNNGSTNDCFVCTEEGGYDDCKIGSANIGNKAKELFTEPKNKKHMEETLENTVCPILPMDFLAPFLPLAPVSIGLSAMAYYLWKYFGPLGKGGQRFRRSPAEIPGSSVQEQVLDHVQQDSSHEYRLVKERKPRSVPTRTKRSGPVNRRTIIEIHFEVLDECQKGDTQLNQKDFLELLVQEFMGSELMEEEKVPKEEVLMEGVPTGRVPSLGSGFMV